MLRQVTRALSLSLSLAALALCARAQSPAAADPADLRPAPAAQASAPAAADAASLEEVRRALREQQAEIERLRATLAEQGRLLELLAQSAAVATGARPAAVQQAVYSADGVPMTDTLAARVQGQQTGGAAAKNPQTEQTVESRVSALEALTKKSGETLSRLGSVAFSGDLRLRYEVQSGLINSAPNAANPAVLGNELSERGRARIRARLALRGQIGQRFDWGLRLATGTTPDLTSTNQTLTDFFGRKPFALDQAFVSYKPASVPGLRLQGGKFETPWLFTEMTFDADISPEGINESYSRDFKKAGALKNLTLVAWQLPIFERAPGFVLNSAGQLDVEASRRAGRDLGLVGAQARVRFAPTKNTSVTLSAADLNFNGTQFITPAQVFGANLQVPVTVTIPATGTTPAQTVTANVNIPRELLVNGSALGVSIGSTNATNRDGRLSSGYNLVDLIGRLEWTRSKRFPVTLLFDFVKNTQARDVVAASGRVLRNREDAGYWAEVQVGKTRERGDLLLGYTFLRIEKDAVLAPFNFSDIVQPTDVRGHRVIAAYAVDPRVTLNFTGLFSRRANGLLGPFVPAPAGSLNGTTSRLQFDTIFRF